MKNKLLIIIPFILLGLSIKAQHQVNGCIVTLAESSDKSFTVKNDTIEVRFNPTEFFWNVVITNHLKTDVSVIWNKSSFVINNKSSKIIFDETIRMKKDDPIQDQEITSGSYIEKNIYPLENLEFSTPTISKRFVKKDFEATGKPHTAKIRLAFLIDGQEKKYDFNFTMVPAKKK